MDGKQKQPWSVEETNCLLALWSSTEIQNKLDGAVRTKPVFEKLQNEMSIAGYQRSVDQLINKIKKLKKDYRDQKRELGRSGSGGRQRRSPHFDVLDSILGDRPACQTSGALNSATALLEAMVNGEADNSNASELSVTGDEGDVDDDTELPPPPPDCNSPVPSTSVSSRQARQGKRKRENEELLEYLEKADDKFLQLNKDMTAKMEADTSALLQLMGRMVAVMEAQAKK